MVKSSLGKDGYRSFTIVAVKKHGGCKTKFHGGRFRNKTPAGAARKAFTEYCRIKRTRGRCTLIVVIKETTRGSSGRVFAYKLQRQKLADPIIRLEGTDREFVIEHKSTIKSLKSVPSDCVKPGQTRGRMKKRTARRKLTSGNNVRRMRSKLRTGVRTGRTRSGKRFR